jgi:outer membrane protein OmpA-like peptidoglycan-associated protein
VRRYLNINDGIPLNRMSVVSYGADKPRANNRTREGSAANRCVTLVVLA